MSRVFVLLCLVFLAACSTAQKVEPEAQAPQQKPVTTTAGDEENIDYASIQKNLGLSREAHQLGYAEKSFNTCDMGYGFSRSQNCRSQVMAVIHFQLLCRDSQGTISTALTREDMRPLAGRTINWSLFKKNGSSILDYDGNGQIVISFPKSPRYQRLKLAANNDALYLKAGEIKRIVTPSNWCN